MIIQLFTIEGFIGLSRSERLHFSLDKFRVTIYFQSSQFNKITWIVPYLSIGCDFLPVVRAFR